MVDKKLQIKSSPCSCLFCLWHHKFYAKLPPKGESEKPPTELFQPNAATVVVGLLSVGRFYHVGTSFHQNEPVPPGNSIHLGEKNWKSLSPSAVHPFLLSNSHFLLVFRSTCALRTLICWDPEKLASVRTDGGGCASVRECERLMFGQFLSTTSYIFGGPSKEKVNEGKKDLLT